MKLFNRNFDKPGPGVPKNAPRKRGVGRFFEVLGRDFGNLVKLNLLFQLCVLPAEAFIGLAVFSVLLGASPLLFLLLALPASIPVGPALTALVHAIAKMLQDEPGFIWHDFKADFKSNFRGSVAVGVVYLGIIAAQVCGGLFIFMGFVDTAFSNIVFFMFMVSVLMFWMVSGYFFIQAAYVELGVGALLKNSLMLAIANAPRSLAAAGITLAFFIVQVFTPLFLPLPLFPVTILAGYAVPCLLGMLFIWPPVDKTFKIEATLKARAEQRLEGAGNRTN